MYCYYVNITFCKKSRYIICNFLLVFIFVVFCIFFFFLNILRDFFVYFFLFFFLYFFYFFFFLLLFLICIFFLSTFSYFLFFYFLFRFACYFFFFFLHFRFVFVVFTIWSSLLSLSLLHLISTLSSAFLVPVQMSSLTQWFSLPLFFLSLFFCFFEYRQHITSFSFSFFSQI